MGAPRASKRVQSIRNAYASVNVTTAAWVQLDSALDANCTEMEIFDSSGQTLQLGIGPAGSEVAIHTIVPGGNGRVPCLLCVGQRLSIKAISGTASTGEIDINLYR